jgi:hypothetical protein
MQDFGSFRGFGEKLTQGQTPTQLGATGTQSAFDSDASSFFDRVAIAGGSLSVTEKAAVNALVVDMKSAGIWTSMKAIYPMVGASAAACAQNLKSSSFVGTFVGGWTFSSSGVLPNGSSAYMDTNFNPSTQATITSTHLSSYHNTDFAAGWSVGCTTATYTPYYAISARLSTNAAFILIGTSTTTVANTNGTGFFLGLRNSNTQKILRNNVTLISGTAVGTTLPNFNAYISALNRGGTTVEYDRKSNAFTSIGDGLTDTQAGNFYTAVQAFQTTLGRQV